MNNQPSTKRREAPSQPATINHPQSTILLLLALSASAPLRAAEPPGTLVLADQGKSEFRIVTASNAPPSTLHAAEELQRFLREITGAELPMADDTGAPGAHEILLGDSAHLRALVPDFDVAKLGREGYRILTTCGHLVIAGGEPRGTLYGVYGLLQDHLGCRWFTPAISRIPRTKRLALAPLDETGSPTFEYREVMLFDTWEADWMARNRINTTKLLGPQHGGAFQYVPDYYVHTFEKLLPTETHFDTHPEYYSEVGGVRLREKNQLCLTNPEVISLVTARVLELLKAHPEAGVISVSQTDGNDNYCQCVNCAALDAKEGSHAAQLLHFVNAVAAAVEKDFPDSAVETLAYEWSRPPPKSIRPHDNVIIRLSTIRCSFSEPIATSNSSGNRTFRRDLESWAKICRRLWVWDYTTYFSYYLLPFPNYRVIDDNLRFFVENNVRGVVEQDNWQSPNGELAGLTGYLAARLLWNPSYDQDTAITEYLDGVYGPAAKPIRAYMDLLSDKVEAEKIALPIYGSRTPKYLTLDVLQAADALWEQAEAAVADQPDFLKRVRIARLSLDYAYIEHYRHKPNTMVTYEGNPRRGKVIGIDPAYAARIRRFLEYFPSSGITHIREGKPDAEALLSWMRGLLVDG